jgi:hypothetical protein
MSQPRISRRRLIQTELATAAGLPLVHARRCCARSRPSAPANLVCIYHPRGAGDSG